MAPHSRGTRIISTLGSSIALVSTLGASASDAPLTCLYAEKNVCQVVAPHIAITVGFDPHRGESLLTYLTPSPTGYVESKSESISPALEADVLDGNVDFEDARLIEAEMLARPQATYFVPSDVQLLLDDVGFPSNKVITPNEYVELLQVHMQLALDISPLTAAFLIERLRIEALPVKREPVVESVIVKAPGVAVPVRVAVPTTASTTPSRTAPTTAPAAASTTAPAAAPAAAPLATPESAPVVIEADADAVTF